MLTVNNVSRVEAALRFKGWWYPPDAIAAVMESRSTYVPLGGYPEYRVTPAVRDRIEGAIKMVQEKHPSYYGAV